MQSILIELAIFTLLVEENVPEIIQQLEFNCYICTYSNCLYYLTVAHKGFPKAQNVVDAIFDICQSRVNELNFHQKEDFLRFIRGENYNIYCGFSVFWLTTLTLYECMVDISGGNILREVYISGSIYYRIFTEFATPAPDVRAYRLLPPVGCRDTSLLRI